MNYDTLLFCEIIESVQGIQFIRNSELDGCMVRVYQGLSGKTVFIDVSDEDITASTGRNYQIQLGLDHLIQALFPDPVKEMH